MHHKRKRPKSRRAGCLMCKPWKRQGVSKAHRTRFGIRRQEAVNQEER